MKLLSGAEDRQIALTIAAGIALHGILASGKAGTDAVTAAFMLAEEFLAEAERRATAAGLTP